MLKTPLWYCLLLAFLMNMNLKPIFAGSIPIETIKHSENKYTPRNLDSALHSVPLHNSTSWLGYGAFSDNEDLYDLYLPNFWAIFISSNETLLNSGPCPIFKEFKCSQPSCNEDRSSSYSQNYTHFSVSEAARVSLTTQEISIAGGAWKLNSPAAYIYSCELIGPHGKLGTCRGQIGLGLSGKASQNFQVTNPVIFSIIFHTMRSGELIFGFNSTYVSENSPGITIPCDLDWKMQASSMAVGDTIISSSTVSMIFDLQSSAMSLPTSYFYPLLAYFTNSSIFKSCQNNSKRGFFICFHIGDLQDLPSLTFTLENETRFSLPPAAYTKKESSDNSFTASFSLHNWTFSGGDYIALGRETIAQYYTVFRQLTNDSAGITIYPHPIDNSFIPDEKSDPQSFEKSSVATITGHSSLPSTAETESHSSKETSANEPLTSSPEDTVSSINVEDHESDYTYLYFVIGIIFIVIICSLSSFMYLSRRTRSREDKTEERQRSTVELNESSYFVATVQNESHENDECE